MSEYISRAIEPQITGISEYYPVIIVTGPRQSGKTTMCRHLYPSYRYVNLEDLTTRRKALEDTTGFVASLGSQVIIDEVQNVPELMSEIQVRVDADPSLKYVLTGSSNFSLLHTVSQSLAGRASLFTLLPFSFKELNPEYRNLPTEALEFNGFYPGVVMKKTPADIFFGNYYTTYVERDLRDLMNVRNLDKFDLFARLMAGRVSSEFNASSLSVEVGVSSNTISEWLSLLKTSYLVFSLPPYYANISKRLTKSSKTYFYDTGLMTYLLGIEEPSQLYTHPLRGAVFENLVVSELMKQRYNAAKRPNYYFYREQAGREVDLLQETPSGIYLSEIKASKTYSSDFRKNMDYLSKTLPNIVEGRVIYDGESLPPDLLNVRNI